MVLVMLMVHWLEEIMVQMMVHWKGFESDY